MGRTCVARGANDFDGCILFTGAIRIALCKYVIGGGGHGGLGNYAPGPGDSIHFDIVFAPIGSTVAIGVVGHLLKPEDK